MNHDPIGTILKHEGGFVNHKNDRGGPTNWGITQKVLSEWMKRPATLDDVKKLTEAQAREIYEVNYLTGPRIDTLPNPPQTFILDMSVNHGPRQAIRILQRVLNAAGFGPLDVDGVLGPTTRQRASQAQETMGPYLQNALVDERIKYYERIIANDPSQEVFRRGWMNRANSFRLPVPARPKG